MGAVFNINSDAAVVMTNKLEKLHRSALPVAVRQTLNRAAFDVKQITLLSTAKNTFEERRKNFFKAKSKVVKAKGFSITAMFSQVGFFGAETNQAVDDLEKQERGGKIGGRSFIPMDTARVSKSNKKSVSKKNRIRNIRAIDRIRSKKDFHKVVHRVGSGGHIVYKGTLFEIKSIKGRNIKLLPIYSFQKGREAKVKATHFMRRSTNLTVKKMPFIFEREGMKQIKRLKMR